VLALGLQEKIRITNQDAYDKFMAKINEFGARLYDSHFFIVDAIQACNPDHLRWERRRQQDGAYPPGTD
jgi:hypothetical protein